MKWIEIAAMPTTATATSSTLVHESIYRSYHVLQKVLDYLQPGVPPSVILELVGELDQLAALVQLVERNVATASVNGQKGPVS